MASLTPYVEGKEIYTPEERAQAWVETTRRDRDLIVHGKDRTADLLQELVAGHLGLPIEVLTRMADSEIDHDPEWLARLDEQVEWHRQWEIIDLRTPRSQVWAFRGEPS